MDDNARLQISDRADLESILPDMSLKPEEHHHLFESRRRILSADFPPPADLTPYISREIDQYIAGGGFGDVYRCWYRDGVPKEV